MSKTSDDRSSRSRSISSKSSSSNKSWRSSFSTKSCKPGMSKSASSVSVQPVKKFQKPSTSKSAAALNKNVQKQSGGSSASSRAASSKSVSKRAYRDVPSSKWRKSSKSSKKSRSSHKRDDGLLITREYVSVHDAKKELYNKSKVHGEGRRRSVLLNQAIQELQKSKNEDAVLEYVCIRRAESKDSRRSKKKQHKRLIKPEYVARPSRRRNVPHGVVSPMTSGSSSIEESPRSRDIDVEYSGTQLKSLGRDTDSELHYHRSNDLPSPVGRRRSQSDFSMNVSVETDDDHRPAFPRNGPQRRRYAPASRSSSAESLTSAVGRLQLNAPALQPNDGGNTIVFTKNIKIQFSLKEGEAPTQADINLDIPTSSLNPNLQVTGLYMDDQPVWHEKRN